MDYQTKAAILQRTVDTNRLNARLVRTKSRKLQGPGQVLMKKLGNIFTFHKGFFLTVEAKNLVKTSCGQKKEAFGILIASAEDL